MDVIGASLCLLPARAGTGHDHDWFPLIQIITNPRCAIYNVTARHLVSILNS